MAPSLERTASSAKTKSNKKKNATTITSSPPPPPARQQSIHQILKSHESKRASEELETPEASPNSKKRKTLQGAKDRNNTSQSPVKAVSKASMYNFSSSRGSGSAVVDLTKSPVSSPNHRSRRISVTARVDTSNLNGAPKRIIVKNLRDTPRSDPNQYLINTFKGIDEALTALFKDRQPSWSNEELYRGAENLCKLGKAKELWKIVQESCKKHVAEVFRSNLVARAQKGNVEVLEAVLDAFTTWNAQRTKLRAILTYLDRAYLLKRREPSIEDTTRDQFRDLIFNDATLKPKIIDGTYDLLLADRQGHMPDHAMFGDAIKMLHTLQVYSSFESIMLARSQEFIMAWADKECAARELPDYVAESVKLMDVEMKRCDQFNLDLSTRRDLLTKLEDLLINRKEAELTNLDSVQDMLDSEEATAVANLEQLYTLLQRRQSGTKLKPAFAAWIDLTGTDIIFDEKEQERMVIRLLALKQKLDNIWRTSFHTDQVLGHALRESFETFINKTKKSSGTYNTGNSKPGEMIAKYLDILMKAGAKAIPTTSGSSTGAPLKLAQSNSSTAPSLKPTVSIATADNDDEGEEVEDALDEDTEVSNQLDHVLDLFRFVHGKAVFEAFYKKDLARRLLMGRSASNDAEKSMLARLKTECGSGFTQNLEQMFKDIELARDEMIGYKQRLEHNDRKAAIDLNVNILSSAAWPSYPDVHVNIPIEIKKTIDNFEQHYNQKHSGRKLQWKHALAHCQLKADFPGGKKELVVSSFQAIVLLLFNGRGVDEHLTYDHIKSEAGLTDAEIQRTLQSLACAKLRPLTKHPKGRDVSPTDTFTLNTSFKHPKYRVKINSIQLKETKEENKETHVRVAADRQFETQAAIVRVMKQRKTISHAELVAEVIKSTRSRGAMDVGEIKKNIDRLIEKEYMERAENNSYEYLA